MDKLEKYDILKKEVDSIQIQLSERKKPWHQNPAITISMIALVFSFGTTGVSYYKNHEEGIRANRREARELIQRVIKLPIENFELMQKNQGSAFGESLSGMINQENLLLATQAVELIKRHPSSFSSTEYFAVAVALSQSNIKDNVPYLFENAVKMAKNSNDYNVSTRAYAMYHFTQRNYLEGRKYYEMALAVWDKFPERNIYLVNSVDLVTLMYWSNAELSINNYTVSFDLITRAKNSLAKLPQDPITTSLARQIAEVERRIEQSH